MNPVCVTNAILGSVLLLLQGAMFADCSRGETYAERGVLRIKKEQKKKKKKKNQRDEDT